MQELEIGFDWDGIWITDPTKDETGRFDVGPDYYKNEGEK